MNPLTSPKERAHPLVFTALVCLLATAVSLLSPDAYSATLVGFTFLSATYWLCLRSNEEAEYGLSLGGLLERAPLLPSRLLTTTLYALAWALLCAAVFFPPFAVGFALWFEPPSSFSFARMLSAIESSSAGSWFELLLGHLFIVALPEEAFFRGYVQTTLERRWGTPWRGFGAELGPGWLVTSLVFALGHLATAPHPSRLAVFFPSLVFGWLRARTGGIGAGVLFHALCNLYSIALSAGYGYAID